MSMRIHIFDVEHGFCAAIKSPNGQLLMIDCGHNSTTGWRPSNWVATNFGRLDVLNISNADEDHVSDLENITRKCKPLRFHTNWNLNGRWILNKKILSGGVGPGVRELARYIDEVYTSEGEVIDYGMERIKFCHQPNKFDDFNNLSLVTFLFLGEFGIVFPGDIEQAGWAEFLKSKDFIGCLARTTVFVASHHGRQNGYYAPVFDYCAPYIVIKSDKSVQHDTQVKGVPYEQHANGLDISGQGIRKVLTTRNDGKITIDVHNNGGFIVTI